MEILQKPNCLPVPIVSCAHEVPWRCSKLSYQSMRTATQSEDDAVMGSDTTNTTLLPLPPYVSWYVPSPGSREELASDLLEIDH